jgi:hypothetical protein
MKTIAARLACISQLFFCVALGAQEVGPISLGPLDHLERERLERPDSQRGLHAMKIGIVRKPSRHIGFDGVRLKSELETSGGDFSWTTAIRSEGATALRLELSGSLPAHARVSIHTALGEVHGPYTGAHVSGTSFWTNTVFADEVFLDVQIFGDPSAARLQVASVLHIEHESFARSGSARSDDDDCLMDVACAPPAEFANLDAASRAVALLVFVQSGLGLQCSGALLNNAARDATPYLLTAGHCFSTAEAAAALEAIWRVRTTDCEDPSTTPGREFAPRSLGSTLLASGPSDFTFVRLKERAPSDAVFLGWDGQTDIALSPGTILFRVSHPQGRVQHYSRHRVSPNFFCSGNIGPLIFSVDELGATDHGSSGSAAMLENLVLVGVLQRKCGFNFSDRCDFVNNLSVDTSLRTMFRRVSQFLGSPTGDPFIPPPPPRQQKRRAVRH